MLDDAEGTMTTRTTTMLSPASAASSTGGVGASSSQLSPPSKTNADVRIPGKAPSQMPAQIPSQGMSSTKRRRTLDKRSMDYVVRSGIAGGLAGCAAKTVVGPLDRVKILFQTSNPQFAKYSGSWTGLTAAMREINRQEGLRGLYRGHSATLLRIFPYAGIKFLAYEQIRARVIPSATQETPWRRLISGSLAGVTSVFFTYPLEVIRVRLAFETKAGARAGFGRICWEIYHEHPPSVGTSPLPASAKEAAAAPIETAAAATEAAVHAVTPRTGLVNFYRGFAPTMWGMLPYAGVSFLTHDTVGDLLRHPAIAHRTTLPTPSTSTSSSSYSSAPAEYVRPRLTNVAELASGAIAGLLSQTAAYPLEVIRRRMQVGGAVGDGHRLSMRETAGAIWHQKGWRGFFVGLGIGYVKVVPMVAVSFWAYERGKIMLGIEG